jgi:hypothetical protein
VQTGVEVTGQGRCKPGLTTTDDGDVDEGYGRERCEWRGLGRADVMALNADPSWNQDPDGTQRESQQKVLQEERERESNEGLRPFALGEKKGAETNHFFPGENRG